MDQNVNPYDPSPEPPAPPRAGSGRIGHRLPRIALAGGVAAGLALGGFGLAYAASSAGSSSTPAASNSPSSSTPSSTPNGGPGGKAGGKMPGPGRLRFGGLGLGLGRGPGGGVVHGSATVHSGTGYKTVELQIGQVTDVSSSSITVKSSDGYTHTYKVVPTTVVDSQAGGISSVAKNDQVDLLATPQNGSDTATNIVDRTKVGASRQGFGFGRAKPAPAPGGAPGSSNSSANFGGFPGGPAPGASGQLQ